MITIPALRGVRFNAIRGSIITFRPTLLVHTRERRPPRQAPIATSSATRSLADHSRWQPAPSPARSNSTSVATVAELGEPG